LDLEVDGEFANQDLFAGRSNTLPENDVGDFEPVELLGLNADEVIATHELAINVGEHITVSNEQLVVGLFVFY